MNASLIPRPKGPPKWSKVVKQISKKVFSTFNFGKMCGPKGMEKNLKFTEQEYRTYFYDSSNISIYRK